MKPTYAIALFILFSFPLSLVIAQNDIHISKKTQKIVRKIIENKLDVTMGYERLSSDATSKELIQLTANKDRRVSIASFWVLAKKNHEGLEELIVSKKNQNDITEENKWNVLDQMLLIVSPNFDNHNSLKWSFENFDKLYLRLFEKKIHSTSTLSGI